MYPLKTSYKNLSVIWKHWHLHQMTQLLMKRATLGSLWLTISESWVVIPKYTYKNSFVMFYIRLNWDRLSHQRRSYDKRDLDVIDHSRLFSLNVFKEIQRSLLRSICWKPRPYGDHVFYKTQPTRFVSCNVSVHDFSSAGDLCFDLGMACAGIVWFLVYV